MPPRRQRMYFITFSGICLAVAAFLVLNAFQDNIVFFRTPTDIIEGKVAEGQQIRIGGLVKEGSIRSSGNTHEFMVTDTKNETKVIYVGILPSLFREGQGIVATGSVGSDGNFGAREVLAKHDETYMPPEVYKDLKAKGYKQ